jgi:hypothetical protein
MASVHHTFETPGPVLVRLAIPEGELLFETADAPRVEIAVEAQRGGQEALDALRIEETERAGRHEILVEAPSQRFGIGKRRQFFNVRVACPEGTAVETASASADLQARGRLGDVQMRTASGDVALQDAASLSVEAASGDVLVREIERDLVVKTTSGDLLARSIGGDLTVAVVSGDVKVATVGGSCRVSTVSGDVEIGELGGEATINGVSGDVELGVAPGRRLWLDVRSASGDVRSDLDVGDAPAGDDTHAAQITVRTVSGDVRLRRAR